MADIFELDEKEVSLAEAQAAEVDADVYVHHFAKPFRYEGKTYDDMVFDFGALTGADGLSVEAELQAMGKALIVRELSGEYCARIAARACDAKIGVDTLRAMPLRDMNRILNQARSFLIRSEL